MKYYYFNTSKIKQVNATFLDNYMGCDQKIILLITLSKYNFLYT